MKKIILYLGLFDQNTKTQEINTIDAYKIASNLLAEFIGFGTITECNGVYTHDNGDVVREPSLRIEVSEADCEKMKRLANALKVAFNQESIMYEEVLTNYTFI